MASQQLSEQQLKAIALALKSRREEKGENLAEVAFRIALSPSQLRAIESADSGPFYSPDYFIQAANRYADFLGIKLEIPEREATPEPETVAAPADALAGSEALAEPLPSLAAPRASVASVASETPIAHAADSALAIPMTMHPEERKGIPWGWIALGAAVLIALGIVKISLDKPNKPAEPLVKAPAPAPADVPAPAVAAPVAAAVAPATATPLKSAPPVAAAVATPAVAPAAAPAAQNDGQLESQVQTWVQIVKSNGEKVNTRIEPGQKIGFVSASTAAIVFGQPDKAELKIQGRLVNLAPFVTSDTPPRALVILNQIKN